MKKRLIQLLLLCGMLAAARAVPGQKLSAEDEKLLMEQDFVFEKSSEEALTEEDLKDLSPELLEAAKNEIYARRGMIFDSEELNQFFAEKSWYFGFLPEADFDDTYLNEVEQQNVALLEKYLKKTEEPDTEEAAVEETAVEEAEAEKPVAEKPEAEETVAEEAETEKPDAAEEAHAEEAEAEAPDTAAEEASGEEASAEQAAQEAAGQETTEQAEAQAEPETQTEPETQAEAEKLPETEPEQPEETQEAESQEPDHPAESQEAEPQEPETQESEPQEEPDTQQEEELPPEIRDETVDFGSEGPGAWEPSAEEDQPDAWDFPAEESTAGVENPDPASEYIFPDANSRYLTWEEVISLSHQAACYAKNEIYARHGRQFVSVELQQYFSSKSWYQGTIYPDAFSEAVFNDCEMRNIELLVQAERTLGGGNLYSLDQPGYDINAVGTTSLLGGQNSQNSGQTGDKPRAVA